MITLNLTQSDVTWLDNSRLPYTVTDRRLVKYPGYGYEYAYTVAVSAKTFAKLPAYMQADRI